ncbi:pyridoxamine 5'-phosphate oxidase [Actinomadura miaoliensis]|uniref:Pyridoxine/pyridoxamine 5'-phosphate oxidase n=1 Tax=Actinomadura miaoliensis TaxID=430685 RepID=A0ABP7W6H2_9ACTN
MDGRIPEASGAQSADSAGVPRAPEIDLSRLRAAYDAGELREEAVPADPLELFARWLADVVEAGLPEPNAMVLATASADGEPSARTVLLKGYGPAGFRFFTNLTSRKGRDLAANPRATLVFPWHPLHRQVIVSGPVAELSREETAGYFQTRPYGSRVGAWTSERQSSVITGRDELEARYAELSARWPDPAAAAAGAPAARDERTARSERDRAEAEAVPLPDFWGGFRVVPLAIEFWQGRPNRLHDRLRYRRPAPDATAWELERLSP